MKRRRFQELLALLLALSMMLGLFTTGYAASSDSDAYDESTGTAAETETTDSESTDADADTESTDSVSAYDTFLSNLKQLEAYASAYAESNTSENAFALVINYIRTGVDRYTSSTWETLAGAENTEFTAYVAEQDEANSTTASALKDLEEIELPNGDTVDFGHMFGTLDITYYATVQEMTDSVIQARADLGGWAGDIADLMYCAENVDIDDKVDTSETDVETLADAIREKYLGADYDDLNSVDHSFTDTDLYGDLDAFYVASMLSSCESISSVLESWFTDSLSDEDRAAYFLENRLDGALTQEEIREAVLEAYTSNTLIYALEASYELVDLDNYETLQTACCYAFADYLFELAGDDTATNDDDDDDNDDDDDDSDDTSDNGYYTVFSSTTTTLAPGITQDITYALTEDDKQIVYYTATIDISRDDVSIYANYNDNDGSTWAMSRVSDQMAAAEEKHTDEDDTENYIENYSAIVGVNADFYNMSTGQPSGVLVMEGVEYQDAGSENFFAILEDGTAMIGTSSDYETYKDQIVEAVGGSTFLVKDGEIVVSSDSSRSSRTCVGITADGEVVLMVLDGRQEPFSAGGSLAEAATIMLEAGCVVAINLDGGGSSTFDAKQEGSDEVTVVNRPSDGYERSVSSSILVVSTAETTSTFDHALITSDTDYLTVGSSLTLTATGVSSTGNAADLPEDAEWVVADTSIGTIEDGVFTAAATGSTEVQLVVDGTVVGSKTLYVVVPDTLLFTSDTMDVIYGEATALPIAATYNGNYVTINTGDVVFELSNTSAGTISGFDFTGDETSGIRNVTVTAMLATDYSIEASMSLALYSEDEARFDFDTAMFGDRSLAWNREVSNSTEVAETIDEVTTYTYYIDEAGTDMVTSYTFALDMQTVEVPEVLEPLLSMVAGGDLEDVTAWDILLQLAERVSSLTYVQVEIAFDENMEVDYSGLTLVNDYFEIGDVEMDEDTNTLTITVNWIEQSEAIDSETANPIVIVSGITLTPKDDADWDEDNCLTVVNSGTISYDIYLGSSTLYTMACQSAFQTAYGIYPYTESDNTDHPTGGHFASTFNTFEDEYTLDSTIKEGWTTFNGNVYYFVNNEALTGIQKLPGYGDEDNEYYYDLGDDGVYSGKLTGLFELDDNLYYAVNGQLMVSWRVITNEDGDDEYYYFDRTTYAAVDGEQTISGHTYTFTNYILTKGAWETNDYGTCYYWAGSVMQNEWFTVDGYQYFAYANTCAIATGIAKTLNHERTGEEVYVFTDCGIWLEDYSGFYDYEGNTYLVEEGVRVAYPGLVYIDGYYYYFNSSHIMIKDKSYYISKTNDLMSAGTYEFDEDGKMVIGTDDDGKLLNGIVKEDDDTWYYYVNGVKTYAGLIQIDGDYYYVNSSYKVIHAQSYYISKTNNLMDAGTYEFDEYGKMVIDTDDDDTDDNGDTDNNGDTDGGDTDDNGDTDDSGDTDDGGDTDNGGDTDDNGDTDGGDTDDNSEVLNGIVKESDTTWYYYVNGVKTYAGLIQIDGYYYYVNSSYKVIHGQNYYTSKTNGLMTAGTYYFDDEGKMESNTDEDGNLLNGIVKEDDDTWYYYVNGVKTYAGLIQIDGYYYYVNSSFKVIHGQSYYISKTNNLMSAGTYYFDEEGKMTTE